MLRTAVPPIGDAEGRRVTGVERLGKRIVIALEGDLYLVMHLMIAGRLRWLAGAAKPPGRITLARFDFPTGRLVLTEAGSKRRASLHLVAGARRWTQFRGRPRGRRRPTSRSSPRASRQRTTRSSAR